MLKGFRSRQLASQSVRDWCRALRLLLIGLVLLAGCVREDALPQTIKVIMFWPEPNTATLWLTLRDGAGNRMAARGSAIVKLWEVPSGDSASSGVERPLYESTVNLTEDSFLSSASDGRPCSLAEKSRTASLGSVNFSRLPRRTVHRMGVIEVTFVSSRKTILVDKIEFALPDR